jgi:hypothetical protein
MNVWDLQSRHHLNTQERRFADARARQGHIKTIPVSFPRPHLPLVALWGRTKRVAAFRLGTTRTA